MRKTTIALVLVVAMVLSLGSVAVASGGKQQDPLISRGYLEGTYLTELSQRIAEWANQVARPDYDASKAKLEQLAAGYLSALGADDDSVLPPGWYSTDEFTVRGGERNDVVYLAAGCGIVWTEGSAKTDVVLVDTTSGTEVPENGTLTVGHRYIATKQATIMITSRSAYWAAQGVWSTTSDGVNVVDLPFTDVIEGSWYYDAVEFVVANKLFNGTGATTFEPLLTMQRGMLTTVLHRMLGKPEVEYTAIFKDVPDNTWYTDGAIWAGVTGIATGSGDGTFRPGSNIARQEIACIFYNYAKYVAYNTAPRGELAAFSDSGSIASWARDAMSWAVAVGILQGSGGKIMPGNSASRAEVAIMLQRFQGWIEQQQ